jgi:DNA-binding transcriptional MerR regulator
MATTLLTIGEFSRMTHLSVKALRHYHDVGVLEPALIDPHSGYRSYGASQVTAAQVIRRLRDLGMPLDSIKAVLLAPDVAARNREITVHLERMERQLAQTQAAVSGLRSLLGSPAPRAAVEFRVIPPVTALAVAQVVTAEGFAAWGMDVLAELAAALDAAGLTADGPFGALFPGDFFELEKSEVTVFVPVTPPPGPRPGDSGLTRPGVARPGVARPGPTRPGLPAGSRARLAVIPGTEAAVAVHDGPFADADRTYAALGTVVAEQAIGVDGPIREYYLDPLDGPGPHRIEICWPVFRTATPS